MSHTNNACLYCGRDSDAIPLIALLYRSDTRWICPQHLPILIHKPEQLAGLLPGMEDVAPADHHDHDHHP